MTEENREKLINWLKFLKSKDELKDNDERNNPLNPCSFVKKDKTVADIDNPFFDSEEDWKEFWEIVKEYYPLHSVCGGSTYDSPEKIIQNESDRIENIIQYLWMPENWLNGKKILEIGFGFGGAGHYLMKKYKANYHGIDFTYSNPKDEEFKYRGKQRFHVIDKSGIPEFLKDNKYNFIFSTNVFQHLTHKQRIDYYKEVYDCLNKGGVFYFDVFAPNLDVEIPENFSTSFFLVHTKVDTKEDTQNYLLDEIGFDSVEVAFKQKLNYTTDWISFKCTK